ncbi:Titin [Manis pentadactyla]|nr:Titin [Manis pentadactyla]
MEAEAELQGSVLLGVQRAATALAVVPDVDGPIPDTSEKGLGEPSATLTRELQHAPLTKILVVPEPPGE